MAGTLKLPPHLTGLTDAEVQASRALHGSNIQQRQVHSAWWRMILDILSEPMLLLLIAISIIYFILGSFSEAYFMLFAIVAVSGISLYQDNRSRKALEALEALNTPMSQVIRQGVMQSILTTDIVPGDLVMAEEGAVINADGTIVYSHDFSVNESVLTGEAVAAFKSTANGTDKIYSGTVASSGLAVYRVETIGLSTRIGQLGSSLLAIREEPTPLQNQIETFVRRMAVAGFIVFLLVWGFNFMESQNLLASLLKGLTLAMSVLPEEIPVAFTTFMALGSRRLMRIGIIVKKTRTVETLGSATVICADKTGTITENRMTLHGVYAFANQTYYPDESTYGPEVLRVIEVSMWASEPIPFDPMEKTIHRVYGEKTAKDRRDQFQMVHEYPLGGNPPMMTHVFENESGHRIIAAKGAPEAILRVCDLSPHERRIIQRELHILAEQGYRILGVAETQHTGDDFPNHQEDFTFSFIGLLAFYDPPKANIRSVFDQFREAGIKVKLITGDNPITTNAIAKTIGLIHTHAIEGEELMKQTPSQLQKTVDKKSIFTRMFPEAKLATVNALKANQEIVAMMGDGVNDGPALKAAHIGIAMGQKGTEIAKNAAALVLLQDDLSRLIDAIATGRRIYANLKKAIQYIISIHIPIMLTVSLPLFFGWIYPDIFTPVHVIFLELIMGPTCSIVYENEPMEKNTMQHPPRPMTSTFLNWKEMGFSIIQGLAITGGVLFTYQLTVRQGGGEELTRAMVFTTLIFSNIFLTLVNRSFIFSFIQGLRYRNSLLTFILLATVGLVAIMLYIPPVTRFFHMQPLHVHDAGISAAIAAVSVFWFEIVKWGRRRGLRRVMDDHHRR